MTEDLTHTVRVIVTGRYPHGEKTHAEACIAGDGGLDHMLQAFAAALVAAGFATDTAAKLENLDA